MVGFGMYFLLTDYRFFGEMYFSITLILVGGLLFIVNFLGYCGISNENTSLLSIVLVFINSCSI